jgi:hypothetical protein
MNTVRRRPRAVAVAIAAEQPAIGPIEMLVALVTTIVAGFLAALH